MDFELVPEEDEFKKSNRAKQTSPNEPGAKQRAASPWVGKFDRRGRNRTSQVDSVPVAVHRQSANGDKP